MTVQSVTRTILILLAVLAVTFTVWSVVTIAETNQLYHDAAHDALDTRLNSIASELYESFTSEREELRSLAGVLAAYTQDSSGGSASARDALLLAREAHPEFYYAQYVSDNGTAFATLPMEDDVTVSQDIYDQFSSLNADASATTSGDIILSNLKWYQDDTGKYLPVMYAATPVVVRGHVYGVLDVMLDLRQSFNEIAQAERSEDSLLLADSDGTYLVAPLDTPDTERTVYDRYSKDVTNKLYSSDPEATFQDGNNVFSYRHLMIAGVSEEPGKPQFWVLASISSTESIYSMANRSTFKLYLSCLVLLMLMALVAVLVSWLGAHLRKNP